jgi:hypothetical protein
MKRAMKKRLTSGSGYDKKGGIFQPELFVSSPSPIPRTMESQRRAGIE